ncbi:hypothetical protein PCANC_19564 [Puccinia coronata f. sp. avenae]|uniref:Uncharacterized protein n=2 Tax=Puccinia coronata f. sp. avenae TaxID=200324 RepID=A0A2N5U4R9_9BASI|nr:hypothetical protein PCANC_19564 [Puccinia coronata f. sp. avenae]PLW38445.1 hypothetical protein PCASD_10335 [Puccinia coronata f. sp. avenae]
MATLAVHACDQLGKNPPPCILREVEIMVDVTGQHSAGFGTAGYEWIQILGLHIAATLVPAKTSSDRLRSASSFLLVIRRGNPLSLSNV